MSPSCDNCGEHVSANYYRVRKGNDGKLHGCPECKPRTIRQRAAAGVDWSYHPRTDASGQMIAHDDAEVATDGGEQA